jgi:putative hemolysin
MLLPALFLFALFLILSAFFSSSETAFITLSPYKIDHLEKKGSRRAQRIKSTRSKLENLLATILIGNTLVNTAAASIATFIFVSFIPDKNKAVLIATVVTTLLILVLSEITPKTYAARNPLKLSLLFIQPIRFFVVIFYPLVKTFTFFSSLVFPSQKGKKGFSSSFSEEEIKSLLGSGVKGLSTLRSQMISGALDIGSRPIREIMIPRPKVKAFEINASLEEMLDLILSAGFSRFPVYKGRLDNIKGTIHVKDIIPYLIDNKQFNIGSILRKPLFVPESASLENVLLQILEAAYHLVLVVDEFGNLEGIVTLEDIIEEIVGEIQDEYDSQAEELIVWVDKNTSLVKGNTPVKEINYKTSLKIPENGEYTTVAGFFLKEFGKIPREGEILDYKGMKLIVEKMKKRQISLLRIEKETSESETENESHS